VQGGAFAREEVAVDGLAAEGVAERVQLTDPDHQLPTDRVAQGGVESDRVEIGDISEEWVADSAADHGGGLEEPLGRRVDPGDTLEDEVADRGREVGPTSGGDEFFDEERIAVGSIGDGIQEARRWRRPGELADQLADLARPQRAEDHLPRTPGPNELTEGDGQAGGTVALRWPARPNDHHTRRPNRVGDEQQQVAGGLVCPVEVLDDDHERLRRRCGDELIGNPCEEAEAVRRIGGRGHTAGRVVACRQVAEDLRERRVGDGVGEGQAGSGEDGCAVRSSTRRELVDQP
jgi:hypothetical protein